MSATSKIEWTDATWNPVTGCTEVSPGCDRCYAKTLAERFRGTPGHYFERGFDVVLRPTRMEQPLRWSKPRKVFVNSMSDLFHADVPDEFIVQVFAVMALAQQHTFQVLTKRHGRMRSLLNNRRFIETPSGWISFEDAVRNVAFNERNRLCSSGVLPGTTPNPDHLAWPLPNVWLGVSVEDQQRADLRVPALLETPAAVRFLSCEPLVGAVDLVRWLDPERDCNCWVPAMDGAGQHSASCRCLVQPEISWVIGGGESGHGARPMSPDWARALRDQCTTAGIPFHFKQWGSGSIWTDRHGDRWTLGADGLLHTPETAPFPREHVERKWGPLRPLGKAAAGRELDGRTWDEFPSC